MRRVRRRRQVTVTRACGRASGGPPPRRCSTTRIHLFWMRDGSCVARCRFPARSQSGIDRAGTAVAGRWGALRAELELCAERGHALLSHHLGAPLYRFPTMAYEASLPVLLAEGDVSEEESMAVAFLLSGPRYQSGFRTTPQPLSRTHNVSNRNSSATFLMQGSH